MGRKRPTPEQIITALREAEVGLARGKSVKLMSRELGISEQTYYRWRREYGGMKVSQRVPVPPGVFVIRTGWASSPSGSSMCSIPSCRRS